MGVNARGKEPIRRQRRRWMDNIRRDIEEISWVGVDCIGLARDRNKWRVLVNVLINITAP
jgi:hypothetical protein